MQLPDQTYQSTQGQINFSELNQPLVLYFYPRDSTPGCTTQATDFTQLSSEFAALGFTVIGVSRDSMASHERFTEKQNLGITLISDTEETLCRHFDVIKEKNMYGKKVFGIERSTFVFDASGALIIEHRKVRAKDHAQKLLDELKNLKG